MNKLELSPEVESSFVNLTTYFPSSVFREADLHIQIECDHIVLEISQVERFEKDIGISISLKQEKIAFMVQDIAFAFTGGYKKFLFNLDLDNEQTTKFRNNLKVESFVEFCIANAEKIQQWPPSWFSKASAHAVQALALHFPDLANATQAAHLELSRKWALEK